MDQLFDGCTDISHFFKENPMPPYCDLRKAVRKENYFSVLSRQKAMQKNQEALVRKTQNLLRRMERPLQNLQILPAISKDAETLLAAVRECAGELRIYEGCAATGSYDQQLRTLHETNDAYKEKLHDVSVRMDGMHDGIENIYFKLYPDRK